MVDELLPYFERELAYLREVGAAFAQEHPRIAGQMGLTRDGAEDPHVARLVESVAFLNARVHHRLDREAHEFSDGLVEHLLPHLQRQLPPATVVQLQPDLARLTSIYSLPAGARLETQQGQDPCTFRTCYPVELAPLEVTSCNLAVGPSAAPGAAWAPGANATLALKLAVGAGLALCDTCPTRLRFYLNAPREQQQALYQLLFTQLLNVVVSAGGAPHELGSAALRPVGLAEDEGLLPYPATSFPGYRLITEWLCMPQKFMFVELDLGDWLREQRGDQLELFVFLRQADDAMSSNLTPATFAPHCTPVVNLFPMKADPIFIDQSRLEYPVVPDHQRPGHFEVISVERVQAASPIGETLPLTPFHGFDHSTTGAAPTPYYSLQRRAAKLGNGARDAGQDIYITLTDRAGAPQLPEKFSLLVDTLCCDRDRVAALGFPPEGLTFGCVNHAPPITVITALVRPTKTRRRALKGAARWQLLSHLGLNLQSLTDAPEPAAALRELLRLYDYEDSAASRALLDSITGFSAKPMVAPVRVEGASALARGLDLTVTLDETKLAGAASILLAQVLDRLFAWFCPLNSFTRTRVALSGREGDLCVCPPRSGTRTLL